MITVIGLGVVGLTTALGLSCKGYKVYGYDIDEKKRSLISSGNMDFFEPELPDVLKKNLNRNFVVAGTLSECLSNSKIVFYCVGTPSKDDGSVDLGHLYQAIESTLTHIDKNEYRVLVVKSTVPPSTTKERIKPFIERFGFKTGSDIGIANNPEFLREGYAWQDFMNPDRIVVGCEDEKSLSILSEIYKDFDSPIHSVSLNTAEFTKYLSNALLSTMISYANEMSMIGYAIGDIDIPSAFRILHEDKRWKGSPAKMATYVYPGCGFGGYCLPKDTSAICKEAELLGFSPNILKSVLDVNNRIKEFVVDAVVNKFDPEEYLGILGLAFKPNTDDVRESPSRDVIELLIRRGFKKIVAYDPLAIETFKRRYNLNIEYSESLEDLLKKTDNILLLTAWDEFRKKKDMLLRKNALDFRYCLQS